MSGQRPPSNRILTETLEFLERSPEKVGWVSPEHYAGVVQRLAGVNDMSWEETQAMLAAPGMVLPGYGTLRRYEWAQR